MPSHHVLYTAAVLLSVSACATTTLGVDREAAPRAKVTLAPLVADETVRLVPHAIEPMLPSADRLSHVIAARLGERADVDVRYCVSPAGQVISAELARGSALPAFDQAVMSDIVTWQFAVQPGPAHVKSCQTATIVYRPRS